MKKSLNIITAVILTLGLSACKNVDTSDLSHSGSSSLGNEASAIAAPVKHENTRINYSNEEIADIINNSRLKASEDIFTDIPKSIDHVSTFYSGTTAQLPFAESVEDFRAAFEYLFPDHEFDESCFYYVGESDIDKKVYENYDALLNGEVFYLFYYDESKTNKEDRVAAALRSPFGSDITTINKNEGRKIAYQMGLASSYGSDIFMPSYYFEKVGNYSPTSEEKFRLLDKEVSIKDAVAFFKNYVEMLPCSVGSVYSVHVNDVQVYKINEELYCCNFTTSRIYDSIPFDYVVSGSHGGRDNRDMGIGAMIKSDDVDFIYGTFKTATIMEEQQFSEIIPFENAVEITAEKMSAHVDFEVKAAMLVYCMDDDIGGSGKLGETKYPVFPAWKLMLYNPNDNCNYSCYVNVLNDEFESYKE
ncbi:MAG: hypothetical protein K2J77_04295 [Oscillospiraceae bacterium]|nr:hypothetical protein [Oscillospiraceae bacterium]